MRIAVVGSGVSGLVAAWLLGRRHEVTVLEADRRLGGHAHTVTVEVEGRSHDVDTGFIVYNEATYPGFRRLLGRLGVETRASDMSFSVTSQAGDVEYATTSIGALFARRRSAVDPRFLWMLREILRFNREAREDLRRSGALDESTSLRDYVESKRMSRRFVDHYLVPMGAAIWSADPKRFLDFPAEAFLAFFRNHGLLDHRAPLQWRTIVGGSRRYVETLVADTRARFHIGCPVLSVKRREDRVELQLPDGVTLAFDHVVTACHSDQALGLLEDASSAERAVLGAITYQPNEAVLHTDSVAMPRRPEAWASWNYRIASPDLKAGRVGVTYWMNRLQGIESARPLFVSLNPRVAPAAERVLARFEYAHPVYDAAALRAQRQRPVVDGAARTHFCGAYWGHGFHEDGVQSALAVCRRFGIEL